MVKSFSLFGLYFYVSDRRMKYRRTVDEKMREKSSYIKKIKSLLYREQEGCCVMCGNHFLERELEAHHIIGVVENPALQLKKSNIVLVCHKCHQEVHQERKSTKPT